MLLICDPLKVVSTLILFNPFRVVKYITFNLGFHPRLLLLKPFRLWNKGIMNYKLRRKKRRTMNWELKNEELGTKNQELRIKN